MNAAIRAVIERLVEALEQYAPRDRAITQDLITEARKLLEGDALAQPADDRVKRACPHINDPRGCYRVRCQLGKRCVDPETGFTLAPESADDDAWLEKAVDIAQEFDDRAFRADTEIQLRAHLRARPARDGFVSVPDEPTEAMLDAAEKLDWSNEDIRGNCCNMFQVMIAAAKGGGK